MCLLHLFAVLIIHFLGEITGEDLEIVLNDGPVQGFLKTSYDNKSFIAFEGIPYAKPPIGELRFKGPEPPEPWTNILYANQTYICTQFLPLGYANAIRKEDCLYINVYVPGNKIDISKSKDVLVHIHGGAFILGAPRMMAGPKYIMNEDLIYVSFNYRLGIFGFLSTRDSVAPGNYGLKDQNFALQWIQKNIEKFGGNPNSVTLTGQSAGSSSVHYHVLSEKSKDLFHKAVLISGTALNPWALTEDPVNKALKLGDEFGCFTTSSELLIKCLREVPAEKLVLGIRGFLKFFNVLPITPFGPTIEHEHSEAFLRESPYQILKKGSIGSDVPMIMSFTKDEGVFPSGYFSTMGQIDIINSNWFDIMQYGLDIQDTVDKEKWPQVLQEVKNYYFPKDDLSDDNLSNLTKLFSDRLYLTPLEKAVRLHLRINKNPIYFYMFDYDSPGFRVFSKVQNVVAHCEDLQLMFNLAIAPGKLSDEDHAMSHFLTKILWNFAHDGVPIDDWQPMDPEMDNLGFYHIKNPSGNAMDSINEIAPTEFWSNLPIDENY